MATKLNSPFEGKYSWRKLVQTHLVFIFWDSLSSASFGLLWLLHSAIVCFLFKICLLIWERERETSMCERNISWFLPICILTGDQTYNLGMCPDRELSLQPFGVRDDSPTSWATLARACLFSWQESPVKLILPNVIEH